MVISEKHIQPYVAELKKKCEKHGIDPKVIPDLPRISDEEYDRKIENHNDVLHIVCLVMKKLFDSIKETPLLVGVTDHNGVVLWMDGDESIKQTMTSLGLIPGVQIVEEIVGPNAVNLAIKFKRAAQIVGFDHYHTFLQEVACYATPFRYTHDNNLYGCVFVMTSSELAHPYLLTMLITSVDSIERELRGQEEKKRLSLFNQALLNGTRNAIIIIDNHGYIMEANEMANSIANDLGLNIVGHIWNYDKIGRYLGYVLATGKKFENIEVTFVGKESNREMCFLFDAFPIYEENGVLKGAFGQLREITERVEAEKLVQYLRYHDELTGLPNRRYVKLRLTNEIKSHTDLENKMGIIQLDLDQFKVVNDTFGHDVGDKLLIEVAHRLEKCLEDGDMVARMNGDEFSIILTNRKKSDEIIDMADRIISFFAKPFFISGSEILVSASLGVAIYPNDGINAESLMNHADSAMYRAKLAGRSNYKVFDPHIYS
jgi:diguanylate cyclase (GGDEF)-like protein